MPLDRRAKDIPLLKIIRYLQRRVVTTTQVRSFFINHPEHVEYTKVLLPFIPFTAKNNSGSSSRFSGSLHSTTMHYFVPRASCLGPGMRGKDQNLLHLACQGAAAIGVDCNSDFVLDIKRDHILHGSGNWRKVCKLYILISYIHLEGKSFQGGTKVFSQNVDASC